MNRGMWIGLFAVLAMAWTSPVLAQSKNAPSKKAAAKTAKQVPTKSAKKAPAKKASAREITRVNQSEDGYSYIFNDDPLAGNSNGANAAQIRVRSMGVRQTLLRPRLHFIPELLRSVEDI